MPLGDHDRVAMSDGAPPERAMRAADPAPDPNVHGEDLNAAAAATADQWIESGQLRESLGRMNAWEIWMLRHAWFYVLFAACAQVFWFVPLGWIPVVALTPLPLGGALWHLYVANRLANHGLVAPGVLVDITVKDSDGSPMYTGVYSWEFYGPHFVTQMGSTPGQVLVLFDPAHPDRSSSN